jgi:hypothetical protein
MPRVGFVARPPTTSLALLRKCDSGLVTGGSQVVPGVCRCSTDCTVAVLSASCTAYAVFIRVHDRHRPASW